MRKNKNAARIWPDDDKKLVQLLCSISDSWPEMKDISKINRGKFLVKRSWNGIESQCRKHPTWIKHFRRKVLNGQAQTVEEKNIDIMEKITEFMVSGRTITQISEKFNYKREQVEKILNAPPDGYRLGVQPNTHGESTFVFLPEMTEKVSLKERIWTFKRHDWLPYIVINMPPDKPWKKINVIPISDVCYGDPLCQEETLDEYINWIASRPDVFTFLNGDIFKKFLKKEKDECDYSRNVLEAKLSRISHKILWAQAGCNEESIRKKFGYDPLQLICNEFGVPYFNQPVYADIYWAIPKKPFTFYCIHGRSNAQTEGGQINAARSPAKFQEATNFFVMSHIKNKKSSPEERIIRDAEKFQLVSFNQYVVICPSFLEYFGSPSAIRGYKPHSTGSVSCRLMRNGECFTSN